MHCLLPGLVCCDGCCMAERRHRWAVRWWCGLRASAQAMERALRMMFPFPRIAMSMTHPVAQAQVLQVLIIEDNRALAANIFDYLEACGHRPDAAPDGQSGLNLAISNRYDAIILDWMLPRMDGMSVLRRLREEHACLLYTSPSPRDKRQSRMPSSA